MATQRPKLKPIQTNINKKTWLYLMHKLKWRKSKPFQIKYQIMIIFNEKTEKWRRKLTGSGSDMMMVGWLSLVGSLPNTNFVLCFYFYFYLFFIFSNNYSFKKKCNKRWLIDNHNSLSIQHEIKTCITRNNSNAQRNNNYSSNHMTNSNSFHPPCLSL